jgi:hypothetical protein
MADGWFDSVTEEQEMAAREGGLRTVQQANGKWGWSAGFGEDWDYKTELEAWADGLLAMEDD